MLALIDPLILMTRRLTVYTSVQVLCPSAFRNHIVACSGVKVLEQVPSVFGGCLGGTLLYFVQLLLDSEELIFSGH